MRVAAAAYGIYGLGLDGIDLLRDLHPIPTPRDASSHSPHTIKPVTTGRSHG